MYCKCLKENTLKVTNQYIHSLLHYTPLLHICIEKKSTLHLNILQAYPRYEEWMNTIAKAIEPLIDSAPPDLPQLLEWKWANIKDNLNQIKALSTTSESVDEIFFQRIFCE